MSEYGWNMEGIPVMKTMRELSHGKYLVLAYLERMAGRQTGGWFFSSSDMFSGGFPDEYKIPQVYFTEKKIYPITLFSHLPTTIAYITSVKHGSINRKAINMGIMGEDSMSPMGK
jgi:hypothetical protein